jgi:hypothetical protein
MFIPETSPASTSAAAKTWARAYTKYAVAGGVPATPKEASFARALEKAFNPELAGGGPALFVQALQTFWLGLPVPQQSAGVVTAVIPASGVTSSQPNNATPQQQANGLAKVISTFTLKAVKVTVPPGTVVPIL